MNNEWYSIHSAMINSLVEKFETWAKDGERSFEFTYAIITIDDLRYKYNLVFDRPQQFEIEYTGFMVDLLEWFTKEKLILTAKGDKIILSY